MPTPTELTAAAKVLSRDHQAEYEVEHAAWVSAQAAFMETWHPPLIYFEEKEPQPPTARDVAKLVLEASEAAREKGAKFAAVGQYALPDAPLNHIVIGPFSTELQARRAGEGLEHDPKTKTGNGRFMVIRIVNKAAEAWDAIRPADKPKDEWKADGKSRGIYGEDYFKGRMNW